MKRKYINQRYILIVSICIAGLLLVGLGIWLYKPYKNFPTDGYGIYDGCTPQSQECFAHLEVIARAGFKVIINYAALQASPDKIQVYAAEAHRLHLKIVWSLKDVVSMSEAELEYMYEDLFQACRCWGNTAQFIAYVGNMVKDFPATYGYYLADEPEDTNDVYAAIAQEGTILHAIDPSHQRLLIISEALPQQTYEGLLRKYLSAPFVDMIGVDFYPKGKKDIAISDTAHIARHLQSIADEVKNKKIVITLQGFSLSQFSAYNETCNQSNTCTPPSYNEMREQRDDALENMKSTLIMWYSYPSVMQLPNQWQNLVRACDCRNTNQ